MAEVICGWTIGVNGDEPDEDDGVFDETVEEAEETLNATCREIESFFKKRGYNVFVDCEGF